jgi:hypothetical protein
MNYWLIIVLLANGDVTGAAVNQSMSRAECEELTNKIVNSVEDVQAARCVLRLPDLNVVKKEV